MLEVNPDIPQWLISIVARLMEKEPEDRFQSADEVAEMLSRCLAHVQQPTVAALPSLPVANPAAANGRARFVIGEGRRWYVGLMVGVLLMGILGFSEAAGVTRLSATVIRLAVGEGTLVIEVDDPTVEISLDGEELTISGAGLQELRLRPGQYQFQAMKDGHPIEQKLVSISRGDREVVRVTRQSVGTKEALTSSVAEPGAFVILIANGKQAGKFDTLRDAVLGSSPGDTIEIRGDGPFRMEQISIDHPLTIRAGDGSRPTLEGRPSDGYSVSHPVIRSNSPLILEGLNFEFQSSHEIEKGQRPVLSAAGPLCAINCRFSGIDLRCASSGRLQNCILLGNTSRPYNSLPFTWMVTSQKSFDISNSVFVGNSDQAIESSIGSATITYRDNTFLNPTPVHATLGVGLWFDPISDSRSAPLAQLKIETSSNLFCFSKQSALFALGQAPRVTRYTARELEELLPKLVAWSGNRNLYSGNKQFLVFPVLHGDPLPTELGQNLAAWKKLWGQSESQPLQEIVKFQGGDLHQRALSDLNSLTREDFRLREDSAGYQSGPDGKDIGANIDLVGPGEAYEHWKQTEDYHQWLMDSRTMIQNASSE
jgi:hypothetical protein